METLKRAFLPFFVVAGAAGVVLGTVMSLVEAQAFFGLPWTYWVGGGGFLAILGLGWTLYRFQAQLDQLQVDVEQAREGTGMLRQRVEEVAEAADAPTPDPAISAPVLDSVTDALRTLYREQEWAREHLSKRNVETAQHRELFQQLEKEWRYNRVLPAMERAGVPRKLIRKFSRLNRVPGNDEVERLRNGVGMRISLLTVAIGEVEKKLD